VVFSCRHGYEPSGRVKGAYGCCYVQLDTSIAVRWDLPCDTVQMKLSGKLFFTE
jgi:hypothetical protein